MIFLQFGAVLLDFLQKPLVSRRSRLLRSDPKSTHQQIANARTKFHDFRKNLNPSSLLKEFSASKRAGELGDSRVVLCIFDSFLNFSSISESKMSCGRAGKSCGERT